MHSRQNADTVVRIVRGAVTAADSAWASEGGVLVEWPRASDAPLVAEGVITDGALVAPLVRRAREAREGEIVIARFADGAPAILERRLGEGCLRDVRFDFPGVGDVILRERARRLVETIVAPCVHDAHGAALSDARLDTLRGSGALLATARLPASSVERNPIAPWLLGAAALLIVAELALRRRARDA
jgi:hypothetical protein